MINKMVWAVLAAALLSTAGAAEARPAVNFLGTTGLLLAPTAGVIGDRGVGAHFHTGGLLTGGGVLAGVTDRLEVSANWIDPRGRSSGFVANAKLALLHETAILPGLSVGVVDAFDQLRVDPSWFVVASKDLGRTVPLGLVPLAAHFGYGGGVYGDRIFAGLEYRVGTPLELIPGRPQFSFLGEFVNRDVNLGARARFLGATATLGIFDFSRIGAGASYVARF
jgi:hypothetical protein